MEVYCASIEKAVESWKIVQSDPNYYVTFGEALFRRIFELDPSAIALFSFGSADSATRQTDDASDEGSVLELSPRVYPHAKAVLVMMERALAMMLENQLLNLGEVLANLGLRHVVYGVVKEHFYVLEAAVLDTLEQTLGDDRWSKTLQKDWEQVLMFMSKGMIVGAEKGLTIKRKERELGELSVATLRLTTPGTSTPTRCRFELKETPKDPPKPVPRPSFDDFLDECLPKTLRQEEERGGRGEVSSPHSAPPKRNSDPALKIPTTLFVDTTPRKKKMAPRRHTSTDLRQDANAVIQGVNRLKLPKSSSPDPKSLLLRNELFGIGLGPAGSAVRSIIVTKKKKSKSTSPRNKTFGLSQSERNGGESSSGGGGMAFEQLDASTSTWPILGLEEDSPTTYDSSWPMLGLEPDATPVLPRRQISPSQPNKKNKKKKKTIKNKQLQLQQQHPPIMGTTQVVEKSSSSLRQ